MATEATIKGVAVSLSEEGQEAPTVLLQARGEIIPILVGPGQAQEIERAREGVPAPRPMTHDLFVGVIDDLDGTLERVRITDIEDDTFYAKLDLTVDRGDESVQRVRDARPSDGIALAVRVGCPVLVTDDVIDEAGRPPETLPIDGRSQGPGGPAGGGLGAGSGREPSGLGDREESEREDLEDAVDIDIEDPEDGDTDTDDTSQS